jgi:hypothetical protein
MAILELEHSLVVVPRSAKNFDVLLVTMLLELHELRLCELAYPALQLLLSEDFESLWVGKSGFGLPEPVSNSFSFLVILSLVLKIKHLWYIEFEFWVEIDCLGAEYV